MSFWDGKGPSPEVVGAYPKKDMNMTELAEYIHQGRMNGSQRNKVKSLFNMLYTPKELSEEIGISLDQIYRAYIPIGCPHSKDRRGRILINGIEFKVWYEETYKKRTLDKNQAYCVSCKYVIEMINPEQKRIGNIIYYLATCPNCGKSTARFIDCKRKKDDQ